MRNLLPEPKVEWESRVDVSRNRLLDDSDVIHMRCCLDAVFVVERDLSKLVGVAVDFACAA